jgi:NitT/TauT family transport system ATP-binding protein
VRQAVLSWCRRSCRRPFQAFDAVGSAGKGHFVTIPKAFHLERLCRSFGELEVLKNLTFQVSAGEFVAIVGPSGCGKTTLLNVLSGFDQPSSGSIDRSGKVRMVYQHDGLFPWLTVSENIALGLRELKDLAARQIQIGEMIRLIRLEGFEHHYPHQLSGGMRQRVELARAMVGQSEVLLMDEPFSALDYLTRVRMRQELAQMLHIRPRTVVLVTHDIEEAAQLADRIFVLSARPAGIVQTLQLQVPRPRHPTHPEVVRAVGVILHTLGMDRDIGELTV